MFLSSCGVWNYWTFWEAVRLFPKWLLHFTFPLARIFTSILSIFTISPSLLLYWELNLWTCNPPSSAVQTPELQTYTTVPGLTLFVYSWPGRCEMVCHSLSFDLLCLFLFICLLTICISSVREMFLWILSSLTTGLVRMCESFCYVFWIEICYLVYDLQIFLHISFKILNTYLWK